ncbi:AAA family ATPase [Burkholderia cenocepacia]
MEKFIGEKIIMFIMGALGELDYYTESEENLNNKNLADYLEMDNSKAQFLGEFLDGIQYSKEAFACFYNGTDLNGKKYTKKQGEHKPGYDLVSTHDKSISLLYASMNREQRREMDKIIREETSKIILDDFKKYIVPSCKKDKYKDIDWTKTKLALAIFTHYENRNVDPHIHNHINLFNFAEFTFNDGSVKTLAIDPINLFKAQKLLSAKLDFAVAKSLSKKFDISFKNVDGSLRVDGITQEHIDKFSDRNKQLLDEFELNQNRKGVVYSSRQEMEDAFDDEFSKTEKAKYLEKIRKTTAKNKEELNYNELMTHFDEIIKTKTPDLTFDRVKYFSNHQVMSADEVVQKSVELINELVDKNSIFSLEQLQTELYRTFADVRLDEEDGKFINIDKLVKHLSKNHLFEDIGENRFTSKEVIVNSFETIEQVKKLNSKHFYAKASSIDDIEKNSKFNGFNKAQKEAMVVATNGSMISHITGDAGTGKTTSVIAYATEHYQSQGHEVVGLSTQGKTAKALEEVGITKTFNIEKFTRDLEAGKITLNYGSVLMVDEAGMVSANHYHKLINIAEQTGSKLVLVGDNKQLSSVAYGNMFSSIEKELDSSSKARLDVNVRQKTQNQIEIAESFRGKNPEKAIELLRSNGDLHISMKKDSREDLVNQLVEKYFNSQYDKKIVIAFKNNDVNYLNDKLRGRLIEEGRLDVSNQVSIDVMTSSGSKKTASRNFAVGDNIVLTGNLKKTKSQSRVDNGTLATIKDIKHNQLVCVDELGNEFSFYTDKFNQFNHAYAVTTYKSQGETVQEAFIYSDGRTTSNQSYVDFSRHKDKVSLFIAESDLPKFIEGSKKSQEKFDMTKSNEALVVYELYKSNEELKKNQHEKIIDEVSKSFDKVADELKNVYAKANIREKIGLCVDTVNKTLEQKERLEQSSLKTSPDYIKQMQMIDKRVDNFDKKAIELRKDLAAQMMKEQIEKIRQEQLKQQQLQAQKDAERKKSKAHGFGLGSR